ncbi:MAG: peptide/nickel transport system ATP-binding protein [Methanofollis sp.]|nr:peptide/nickel transport system ATP-binding protein [Methanofollis sp.]
MSLLEVSGLNVTFPTQEGNVRASSDVSFSLDEGEVLGLIGESGSGKSVIGLSILRLLPAYAEVSGRILFRGIDLAVIPEKDLARIRGREIALLPQNPVLSLNPLMQNGRQLAEVYEQTGDDRVVARKKTLDLLQAFSFHDPAGVYTLYPHQLSGGMRQRLTAGIALSYHPSLLIADEPTRGLDRDVREKTIDLFRKIEDEFGTAILLITHDLDLAERLCSRIVVMYAGEIVEIGPAGEVFEDPAHPYTQGLLRARPRNGLVPLPGMSPGLSALPPGCRFAGRCGRADVSCTTTHPTVSGCGPGRCARCRHLF